MPHTTLIAAVQSLPKTLVMVALALVLALCGVTTFAAQTSQPVEPPQPSAATTSSTPASDAANSKSVASAESPKVICRNEKVTGSKLRSRKVCSSPDSESKSGDWVREQQARGAIGAGAIVNGGP